ncbi:hypothetical protein A9K55_005192 [Cordyceps militaris]|uniref:SMODS and SLOG-associating 2TM effector domain-containing protein n=1 Tax=Cordyceps militaris TaxID=73501 RepID=A0A2H4SP25_CORMI|nr:hypothetical protein A9K55_005192 [Cordyceps militaris]
MPATSSAPSNFDHRDAPENRYHRRASPPKPLSLPQNRPGHPFSTNANNMSFQTLDEDERRPLLLPRPGPPGTGAAAITAEMIDHHDQFCQLVGVRPLNHPHGESYRAHPQSLYVRAVGRRRGQNLTYMFTASLVNTLLLSQVVLGAALTGLGASNSSRVLITVFGALNTVIAGVVAFLKSRGQPMRARMFRDDLSRVVDEIENSAVMWFGISQGAHGYGAIDTDDQVTVRGEVARLTRLYDRAVKNNTMNDPDMYNANGASDSYSAGLRKVGAASAPGPLINSVVAPPPGFPAAAAPAPVPVADPDDSPASKPPERSQAKSDASSDKGSDASKKADPPAAAAPTPEVAQPAAQPVPAADTPAADAASAETPAVETPKPVADDKPVAAAAAAPPPPPAPIQSFLSHADPDESPASSATPPKRESSTKTLVNAN